MLRSRSCLSHKWTDLGDEDLPYLPLSGDVNQQKKNTYCPGRDIFVTNLCVQDFATGHGHFWDCILTKWIRLMAVWALMYSAMWNWMRWMKLTKMILSCDSDVTDVIYEYLWWVHVFMLMLWWYQWAHSMDWFKRKIRGKREFWPKMIGGSCRSSQIFLWSNSGAHVLPTLIDLVFLSATTYCWISNHPSKTVCRKKHNYLDGNVPQFFPVSLKQCRLFFLAYFLTWYPKIFPERWFEWFSILYRLS